MPGTRPAVAVGTLSEHCWCMVQVRGHAPKQTACRSELPDRRSCVIHAGSEFEEGWLIVKCQYYKLEQVSERGYRLLPAVKYLVVNAMVRISGLGFIRSQGGPQQRSLRTTATGPAADARRQGVGGLSFLSEDMHNAILVHACACTGGTAAWLEHSIVRWRSGGVRACAWRACVR